MLRNKSLGRLTSILIVAAAFIFLMCFPLTADEDEGINEDVTVSRKDKKADNILIDLYLTPLEQKPSINLELFQLINREDNHLKALLSFKPIKVGTKPDYYKYFSNHTKVNRLENSFYNASLITLTMLNVADYFSTLRALKCEGLIEGNPIMRPFTKNTALFTAVKFGLTAYNYYFLKNLYKKNKSLAWALSVIANFAMSYIVANNIRKIQNPFGN